ncbi:MAG TPA: hypothetical protein VF129_13725 [Actinomycetota bacterium]
MPWGKIAVVGLATLVTLGLGLVATQPWKGPNPVDALELDQAWKDGDAPDGEIGDDDDDGDDTGTRTRGGARDASRTDDGRDGTREGDTRGARGTGTADSVAVATNTGGDRDTNGGVVTATDDGGGAPSVSRDSVSGGSDT